MPEIAEVNIITGNVRNFLLGNTLTSVDLLQDSYGKKCKNFQLLQSHLPLRVIGVQTKGKFSWIELENGHSLSYGLGMTGNIRIEPTPEYLKIYNSGKPIKKQDTAESYLKHALLQLNYQKDDGTKDHFYYHDMRRFGNWVYMTNSELQMKLKKLGSDPIHEELTPPEVIARFRRYDHKNICTVLMNQEGPLSGVGNYIKAEVLYASQVSPHAIINKLTDTDLLNIYSEVRDIAMNALKAGGATLYTYTGLSGDQTEFKQELKIYKKKTDPLGNCVEVIQDKKSPDRRTTHWVPAIQIHGTETIPQWEGTKRTPSSAETPIKIHIIPKQKIKVSIKIKD